MSTLVKKIITTAAAASIAVSMVAPMPVGAVTIAELQAQINALLAQLQTLQAQQAGTATACTFTRSLYVGVSSGDDVMCLQQYLNSAGSQVAASGAGSPGSETRTYGPLTQAAVAKWQAANGVSPAVGYFGPISRAKYSMVASGTVVVPTPGTVVPGPIATSGALTVSAGVHPSASLFPENAARVPFTVVRFTDFTGKVHCRGRSCSEHA